MGPKRILLHHLRLVVQPLHQLTFLPHLADRASDLLAHISCQNIRQLILPLVKQHPGYRPSSDALVNDVLEVANLPDMLIVKLKPHIKHLAIEVGPVMPAIVADHASEHVHLRQALF